MLAHVLQCCESIEYVMPVVRGQAYSQLCSFMLKPHIIHT